MPLATAVVEAAENEYTGPVFDESAYEPRSRRSMRRSTLMLIVAAAIVLIASAAVAAQVLVRSGNGVLLVTDASGQTQRLDGATLDGQVFITLDEAVSAIEVRFYVGDTRDDSTYRGADRVAPFNLAEDGEGNPQPLDVAAMGPGEHTVWATYRDNRGWHHTGHRFTVGADKPDVPLSVTGSVVPSGSPGRNVLVAIDGTGNAVPLNGATLSGQVVIALSPDVSARQVRFYVGPERDESAFVRTDRSAPFSLNEDRAGASLPVDTAALGVGQHMIWATYDDNGRWRHVGHRITVIDAAGTTGAGTPDPESGGETSTATPPATAADPSAPSTLTVETTDSSGATSSVPPPTGDPASIPAGSGVLVVTDGSGNTARLDGAEISGNVRVWLDPKVNAKEVRFYVGRQRDDRNLRHIARRAPFEFVDSATGAPTVAASSLGTVIYATYNEGGLWRHVRHDFAQGIGTLSGASSNPTTPTTAPPTSVASPAPTAAPSDPPVSTGGGSGTPPPPPPSGQVASSDIIVSDSATLISTLASRSIPPGTTVWLRGGVYRGPILSASDGTKANPIVIRSYPGEHAIIDGASSKSDTPSVDIDGDWQTWTDLEFTNSAGGRNLGSGSNGRPTLLHILGRGTAIINNSIHDGGNCIGWWKSAYDSTIYGNMIYDCGWDGTDRPHGHGVYVQNLDDGRKLFEQNIVSATYGRSILTYGSDQVHNVDMYNNVFAGGESLGSEAKSPVYLSGAADDLNFVGNHVYTLQKEPVSFVDGGANMRFDNNYVMTRGNAIAAIWVRKSRNVSGQGNHIVGYRAQIRLEPAGGFKSWDRNTYYGLDSFYPAGSLSQWRSRYSVDANSSLQDGLPSKVVVAPNRYDDDRALVTIWNGARADAVSVDLSGVLEPGDRYEILGGQDLGGQPLRSGTYSGGAVSIPMTNRPIGSAVGGARPDAWGTEFGAFVVVGS